jgi:hypothetical protein
MEVSQYPSEDKSPPSEGSESLNGKDATFRNAPMVSAPRLVPKLRLRGALVPFRRLQ